MVEPEKHLKKTSTHETSQQLTSSGWQASSINS
jgi:hypothetical protein